MRCRMAVAVSPHLRLFHRCPKSETGLGLQFLQIERSELMVEHDARCQLLDTGHWADVYGIRETSGTP